MNIWFDDQTKIAMVRATGFGGTAAGCSIRKAILEDIPDIYRIELLCFPDPWDFKGIFEMMTLYKMPFFVAVAEERVVGFAAGMTEETGEAKYGHICSIGVTPELRGFGIGRLLLRKLEHGFFLEACTACSLEVRAGNLRAQGFYEKLGYDAVIQVGGYYADGEDALVMMRWF
jgi:ribosomal-protein-alanine N-acetyltransferase